MTWQNQDDFHTATFLMESLFRKEAMAEIDQNNPGEGQLFLDVFEWRSTPFKPVSNFFSNYDPQQHNTSEL